MLATIVIVECMFHCVSLCLSRFHCSVWGTAVLQCTSVSTGSNGIKMSPLFFFLLLLYVWAEESALFAADTEINTGFFCRGGKCLCVVAYLN